MIPGAVSHGGSAAPVQSPPGADLGQWLTGHVGTSFKFTAWPLSSDLVITGEENIKFVQSDQNGVIWHLEFW